MKKLYVVLFIVSCLVCAARAEDATGAKGSLPPPEKKELKMSELKSQLVDLNGKVVPAKINHVYDLAQVEKGKYRAWCDWFGQGLNAPLLVTIPEEGFECFQTLSKKDDYDGGGKVVYLKIQNKKAEAVGTRYSKSKGEYSW